MFNPINYLLRGFFEKQLKLAIDRDDANDVHKLALRVRNIAPFFHRALVTGRNECAAALAQQMPTNDGCDKEVLLCLNVLPDSLAASAVDILLKANGISAELAKNLLCWGRRESYANALVASGCVPLDFINSEGEPVSNLITADALRATGKEQIELQLKQAIESGRGDAAAAFACMVTEPLLLTCSPQGSAVFHALAASPHLTVVATDLASLQQLVTRGLSPERQAVDFVSGRHSLDTSKLLAMTRRLCDANPGLKLVPDKAIAEMAKTAAINGDHDLWQWLVSHSDLNPPASRAIIELLAKGEGGFSALRWLCEQTDFTSRLTVNAIDMACTGAATPLMARYLLFLSDMVELDIPAGEYAARYRELVANHHTKSAA